jgi:hypothetical protein
VLLLDLNLTLVGVGCPVNQAQELHLSHILGLVHNCKLTLEKGDLLSRLFNLPASRSQQDGTLLGHPLSLGGQGPHHNDP